MFKILCKKNFVARTNVTKYHGRFEIGRLYDMEYVFDRYGSYLIVVYDNSGHGWKFINNEYIYENFDEYFRYPLETKNAMNIL